jgi:hypothetical protein
MRNPIMRRIATRRFDEKSFWAEVFKVAALRLPDLEGVGPAVRFADDALLEFQARFSPAVEAEDDEPETASALAALGLTEGEN